MKYKIFKRSCTNLKQFARARKITIDYVDSVTEAQRVCNKFNDARTPAQIRAGTKYEFTSEF